MNSKIITITGPVRGKGRPRTTVRNNKIIVFKDKKTASYEKLIKQSWLAKYGRNPTEKPVKITIAAFMKIPKGKSKRFRKKAENQEIVPTKKPDLSNILKIAEDALNGVAYLDDKQIYTASIIKLYDDGEGERLVIIIEERGEKDERK